MDTTSRTTDIPAIGVQQGAGTGVTVKSKRELDLMWEAGQIVGHAHNVLRSSVAAASRTWRRSSSGRSAAGRLLPRPRGR